MFLLFFRRASDSFLGTAQCAGYDVLRSSIYDAAEELSE